MKDASLRIRSVAEADRTFFCQAVAAFYASPAVCHAIPSEHAQRTFDRLMEGTPFASCLIAEQADGTRCGYCLLAHTWSNEAGGPCVWLEELMVLPEFREKGIGAALIEAVRAQYPDAARFRLEVTAENPRAAALYQRLGFSPLPYCQMTDDRG